MSSFHDELEHLTEEEVKEVLNIYPKKEQENQEDSGSIAKDAIPKLLEEKGLEKKSEEQKEDLKDGYLDYEVKNKESSRISYSDDEIEVLEEEF